MGRSGLPQLRNSAAGLGGESQAIGVMVDTVIKMIYEYTYSPPMCGVRNRKRIRSYDPAAKFLGHSYHPVWQKTNRSFLTIQFESEHQKLLFELEFSSAKLVAIEEIPEMEKVI